MKSIIILLLSVWFIALSSGANCLEGAISSSCLCGSISSDQLQDYSSGYCYNGFWHDKAWGDFVIFEDDFDSQDDWVAEDYHYPPFGWSSFSTPPVPPSSSYDNIEHYSSEINSPGLGGLGKSFKTYRRNSWPINYNSYDGGLNLYGDEFKLDELFIRFYMKIPSDWDALLDQGSTHKFSRFWIMNSSNKVGGEILFDVKGDTFGSGIFKLSSMVYDELGPSGGSMISSASFGSVMAADVMDGMWHSYEIHVKLNSQDMSDGKIDFWFDGERQSFVDFYGDPIDANALMLRADETDSFGGIIAPGIGNICSGGCCLNGSCSGWTFSDDDWRAIEFDNYVVASEYIGPLVEVVCGDGVCSGVEDCSSCFEDCGACVSDCLDADNDSYGVGVNCLGLDCDDLNPLVWANVSCVYDGSVCLDYDFCGLSCPEVPVEVCGNGVDEDCDGVADECVSGSGGGLSREVAVENSAEEDSCLSEYFCGEWGRCSSEGERERACIDSKDCEKNRVEVEECELAQSQQIVVEEVERIEGVQSAAVLFVGGGVVLVAGLLIYLVLIFHKVGLMFRGLGG